MTEIRFLATVLFMTCIFMLCPENNPALAEDQIIKSGQRTSTSKLAQQVTIHRDQWGVAHLFGDTDESTLFGAGYAQAEDYFWQLEDTTIQAVGRYAEVRGKDGLKRTCWHAALSLPVARKRTSPSCPRKARSFSKPLPPV